jgi:hypothetical protein
MNLELKFETFQAKLDQAVHSIQFNYEKLEESIREIFEEDKHSKLIDKKRLELIKKVFDLEERALKNPTASVLFYFKQNAKIFDNQPNAWRLFIDSLSKIAFKNDLTFHKKIFYQRLHNFTRRIYIRKRIGFLVQLGLNRCLTMNFEKSELLLLDSKSITLKVFQVKEGFICYQLYKVASRVLFNFIDGQSQKSFIYVCDFDLRPIKIKFFKNRNVYVYVSQQSLFYFDPGSHTFSILNLDLELVATVKRNDDLKADLNYILLAEDRLVLQMFDFTAINIIRKEKFEIVKTIQTRDASHISIFVDNESYIYATMKPDYSEWYELTCYDTNGHVICLQKFFFPLMHFIYVNDDGFHAIGYKY